MAWRGFGKTSDKKPLSRAATERLFQAFQKDIDRHQDVMYGVALFFECISLLYAEQEAVIETYRKQFRNIIQSGHETIERATCLLEEVRADDQRVELLKQFRFAPCQGYPDPEQMVKRATTLTEIYRRLFPDRPREDPFTDEEKFQIIDALCEPPPVAGRGGK